MAMLIYERVLFKESKSCRIQFWENSPLVMILIPVLSTRVVLVQGYAVNMYEHGQKKRLRFSLRWHSCCDLVSTNPAFPAHNTNGIELVSTSC